MSDFSYLLNTLCIYFQSSDEDYCISNNTSKTSNSSKSSNDSNNRNEHNNNNSNTPNRNFSSLTPNVSSNLSEFNEQSNIENNNFGIYTVTGVIRKGNKKKDFCIFCETYVLNFARHVTRNHSNEIDVQKILVHPAKSPTRKRLLDTLRNKGNYLNSNVVCKPVQKPRVLSQTHVLPCTNCLGFFSAKLLWRHRKKCCGSDKNHQAAAQNLLLFDIRVDPDLKQSVFPKMRADEISMVAKKDSLICAFGARYIKIHREKHFINVTSRKMRELARLLIELRKIDNSIASLFDALKPKYFDSIIAATKIVAKYDTEKNKYDSPTYALNMGTTLKQCADLAIIMALKRKNVSQTVSAADTEAELKTFIQIVQAQWHFEISSQAASDLNLNKWNKVTIVPLASGKEIVYCRVLILNRRRPGELQRLPLHIYETCTNGEKNNYEEFSDIVTPSEKILLKKFKRVVIRGKRGRGVPVLFSDDIQDHIKVLLHHRPIFLSKKNIYLFGNPGTIEPICGYKILNKYAHSCGAKNPKAISSTKLRKHLATLTQIFSMTDSDLEQLATFMGHSIGVHRGNYRLLNDVYQTAKISKLLLLMETGGTVDFKGKTLNEININMEEDLMEKNDVDDETSDIEEPIHPIPLPPTNTETNNSEVESNKKSKSIKIPWTEEQKKIVRLYFAQHIKKRKPPKRLECEALKEKNTEILNNKDWLKIKVFIQNEYNKKSKK
ncbi:hypothetical protein ABEB36_014992 [Hypothenemus hampei]|uniref:Uncharacterized protein n=1 Tax=Hypothenemus hampei TaxID=57062 RepID=A0ABD1E1H0_HYPHA